MLYDCMLKKRCFGLNENIDMFHLFVLGLWVFKKM